jgi:hypothetical protein
MKNEQVTYEQLTGYLKSVSPAPGNPGELTRDIIARVERAARDKRSNSTLCVASRVSGIAACLLTCLLISEIARTPASYPAGKSIPPRVVPSTFYTVIPAEKRDITRIIREKLESRARAERVRSALLHLQKQHKTEKP